jgi:response regulator of citrate/malate metabolism
MSSKAKILIAIVSLGLAYTLGRYMAPEKSKTETKIVEVEKKVVDQETEKKKHKKTVIVKNPNGTTTTTITEDTDTSKNSHSIDETSKTTDQTKEVTKSTSKTYIYALAGTNLFSSTPSTPVYGAHVSKDLFGPVSIGIWGLSSGVAGASVGISF